MQEVQPGPVARWLDLTEERVELGGSVGEGAQWHVRLRVSLALVPSATAEVPEGLVDGGKPGLHALRRDQVERHHAEVLAERPEAIVERLARSLAAEPLGADLGSRLRRVDLVAIAEQREQAVRVVGRDRQHVRGRPYPG